MTTPASAAEYLELQQRLAEAEETLRAIREGSVDAFLVEGPNGSQVYTLEGADRSYRLLVEKMQQGAATLNTDGEIVYSNLSLAQLLHVPHERLIGQALRRFVAPASATSYADLLREGSTHPRQGEIQMHRADGALVSTHLSLATLAVGGRAMVGVLITDLTAQNYQKELTTAYQALQRSEEELRRANADLEQFAYSASHDLQEPIRNLAVYSELLGTRCADALDAKGKQYLSFITAGARRMEALVKDLLAYTQSTSADQDQVEEVSATIALEKALANLSEAIRESQAEVLYKSLPNLSMREVQMEQLFQNIIGNAIKYRCATEPPRIRIDAERDSGFWKFSIRDNGIGIPPEFRQRIFGLFKRLHNDSAYSGTGIGLAICQRIVERYGGRIWVTSNGAGTGSTFFFTVPTSEV